MYLNCPKFADIKPDDTKLPRSLLLYSMNNGHLVSVELTDSGYDDLVGLISDIRNDLCTIVPIDEYSSEDGIGYCHISDITCISRASEDENRIARLWQTQH